MFKFIKNKKLLIGMILVLFIFLTNLQYLPSFGDITFVRFSNFTFNVLSVISILLILIGLLGLVVLIWILIKNKLINKKALFIVILGLLGYLNSTIIHKYMSKFARGIVIKNANELICSIDKYYLENSKYPDSLNVLVPEYIDKIPKAGVHGINRYNYQKLDKNYEIWFNQNDIMNFNYNVVIYNPKGEHKGHGEQPELIDTEFKNWKYYWSD
jgi:hypothetical protein